MNRQTGSALILSLLILLVMTMLGISVMSTSTLEEKMAANDRNQKVSFQNAELTLSQAENTVLNSQWQNQLNRAISDGEAGYYDTESNPDYFDSGTWVADTGCIGVNNNQSGNHACYTVEKIGGENQHNAVVVDNFYGQRDDSNISYKILKVTARSADGNNASAAMVQSTIRKTILSAE